MKAHDIRFRCSSLGHLMTDPRSKSESVSETTKVHLVDVFVSAQYGRYQDITNKYTEKGNAREQDSITLLSRVTGKFYKKNDQRLTDDHITGEMDLYIGKSITEADHVIDIKTAWSANTFFRNKVKGLDKAYYWQVMGYMALTGAKSADVAFCLVNSPAELIMDEKRKVSYQFGADPDSSDEYREKCMQIEKNHIFDMEAFQKENPWFDFHSDIEKWTFDIPKEERVIIFRVERDQAEIDRMYQRCIDCKAWMDANLFKTSPELV